MNFDDLKKKASLPTETVSLCLAGELVEELEQLEAAYLNASPAQNLGDGTKRQLAEQITAKRDEMEESTVDFHLRALPARAWSKFWANMPMKEEKESDESFDDRRFPFYAEMVSRTLVEPEMTPEQAAEFAEFVHASAWNRLAGACLRVNMGTVDIPNSVAASELIGSSEQT